MATNIWEIKRTGTGNDGGSLVINDAPHAVKINDNATTNPNSANDINNGYSIGSIWVDTSRNTSYICKDNTSGNAVWEIISFNQRLKKMFFTTHVAVISVLMTAPQSSSPTAGFEGDTYIDTDDGVLYQWDGGAWISLKTLELGDRFIVGNDIYVVTGVGASYANSASIKSLTDYTGGLTDELDMVFILGMSDAGITPVIGSSLGSLNGYYYYNTSAAALDYTSVIPDSTTTYIDIYTTHSTPIIRYYDTGAKRGDGHWESELYTLTTGDIYFDHHYEQLMIFDGSGSENLEITAASNGDRYFITLTNKVDTSSGFESTEIIEYDGTSWKTILDSTDIDIGMVAYCDTIDMDLQVNTTPTWWIQQVVATNHSHSEIYDSDITPTSQVQTVGNDVSFYIGGVANTDVIATYNTKGLSVHSGVYANQNDYQNSLLHNVEGTNTPQYEMFMIGCGNIAIAGNSDLFVNSDGSTTIDIPVDEILSFEGIIQTNTNNTNYAVWYIKTSIVNNSGTTALLGDTIIEKISYSVDDILLTVSADDTNDCLVINISSPTVALTLSAGFLTKIKVN